MHVHHGPFLRCPSPAAVQGLHHQRELMLAGHRRGEDHVQWHRLAGQQEGAPVTRLNRHTLQGTGGGIGGNNQQGGAFVIRLP